MSGQLFVKFKKFGRNFLWFALLSKKHSLAQHQQNRFDIAPFINEMKIPTPPPQKKKTLLILGV